MEIVSRALTEKRTTLSEHESTQVLVGYGIPVSNQILVREKNDLEPALRQLGFPVVMKGCSPDISHKTEKGLIRMDIRSNDEAASAYDDIRAAMEDSRGGVLVQELIKGERQLMVGMTRDPQFGPAVMFGLGGIFTEILKDVSFRLAPLEHRDALDMMREIKAHRILDAVRGMEPVDQDELARIIVNVGRIGVDNQHIKEIDINPLIVRGRSPVAVDALIVLE